MEKTAGWFGLEVASWFELTWRLITSGVPQLSVTGDVFFNVMQDLEVDQPLPMLFAGVAKLGEEVSSSCAWNKGCYSEGPGQVVGGGWQKFNQIQHQQGHGYAFGREAIFWGKRFPFTQHLSDYTWSIASSFVSTPHPASVQKNVGSLEQVQHKSTTQSGSCSTALKKRLRELDFSMEKTGFMEAWQQPVPTCQ